MRLQQSTWIEVKEYLEKSSGIILPAGSTEQHGPTGVLGVDTFCAEAIAWRVGELSSAMVGPCLNVGMSEHHMTFSGSMSLRPSTYIALVYDCILSLAHHGFRRFFIINGHGGNTASLNAAFSEIYGEIRRNHMTDPPDIRCKTLKWFENKHCEDLSLKLFGLTATGHASAAEVSISQFAHTENIKQADLHPQVAPDHDHVFYDSQDFRRRFADGRIESDPSAASSQAGGEMVETAACFLSRRYEEFLSEI
jgi:creatinine amidohydrolase